MSLNKICVIAANNSTTSEGKLIDYVQLASIAAERVKYYLGLDTYILTDNESQAKKYSNFAGILTHIPTTISNRSMIAGQDIIQYNWINDARIDAYKLTKDIAKKVLMIDADYMVASDQLSLWLKVDSPFLIFNKALDISGAGVYDSQYFPSNDITQRWATAISWNNCLEAEAIFETAKMVRDNYDFYAVMLGMPKKPFRNDLAFSVACHLHNVSTFEYPQLYNLLPNGVVEYNVKSKEWIVVVNDKCLRWYNDIHILNKNYAIDYSMMNQLRLRNVEA
jgi:hypothetical protein